MEYPPWDILPVIMVQGNRGVDEPRLLKLPPGSGIHHFRSVSLAEAWTHLSIMKQKCIAYSVFGWRTEILGE